MVRYTSSYPRKAIFARRQYPMEPVACIARSSSRGGWAPRLRRCWPVDAYPMASESALDPNASETLMFWTSGAAAHEAHTAAQAMTDPAARRQMYFIAGAHKRLADHAERTARCKRASNMS
jgi:hypothetical protein